MSYYLAKFIDIFFSLYYFALFARVLLSWFPSAQGAVKIRMILHDITDPVLEPIKKVVPPIGGMIDISPIIAFFLLDLVRSMLLYFLSLA